MNPLVLDRFFEALDHLYEKMADCHKPLNKHEWMGEQFQLVMESEYDLVSYTELLHDIIQAT